MLKSLATGIVAGGLMLASPMAAHADDHGDTKAASDGGITCIDTYRIKTTKVVDNQTVIFRMRGGPDYKMTLTKRCPGLKMQKTIMYEPMPSHKLCSVDTIKVPITTSQGLLNTMYTHCMIDNFAEVSEEAEMEGDG